MRATWTSLGLVLLSPAFAAAKPRPPQMTVRLIAQTSLDLGGILQRVTVYVILPDGTHVAAECSNGYLSPSCVPESFAPEKRVAEQCVDTKRTIQVTCFTNIEGFYADRLGNELLIYAANGKRSYHITGSWSDFSVGTRPQSGFDPNWTAVCNDGTFSYSQSRSGTCSDHGGVQIWHP